MAGVHSGEMWRVDTGVTVSVHMCDMWGGTFLFIVCHECCAASSFTIVGLPMEALWVRRCASQTAVHVWVFESLCGVQAVGVAAAV